ncbi:MAG: L-aspartate oxidase [Actinobacteria bacterium]|nr:L-aspartate oxidase [Actinomycetota bacterium]
MALPRRLAAPEPTWTRDVDVVVLGSGAAGLAAALAARPVRNVLIVTKDTLDAGSTAWAQGGLAAVLDPTDTFAEHVRDTLEAGAGLCDEAAVTSLVRDAPTAIDYLEKLGAAFDPGADGERALTREGGHSRSRIVHAGGDQSGAEIQRTLDENAINAGVEVLEHAFALDLEFGVTPAGKRQVAGVRIAVLGPSGEVVSVGIVTARAVVVATGGYGQVFASTSNPAAVTGDGHALALRAGLVLRDLEFVQFHPTVLWQGVESTAQQTLISEAVRGEGAVLFDAAGERIMKGVHPLEDLAPRDVVAAAISERMARAVNGVDDHVYLDATSIGIDSRNASPSSPCVSCGRLRPGADRIPVAPAAHYTCGGIDSNLDGTTSVEGLYAVGEVAYTGVHGANRLASNSLTESLVVGTRVGRNLAWKLPSRVEVIDERWGDAGALDDSLRAHVRTLMSKHVGVLRRPEALASTLDALGVVADKISSDTVPNRRNFEATNIATVASAVTASALARTESRGCHRRTDVIESISAWQRHLEVSLDEDGLHISGGVKA